MSERISEAELQAIEKPGEAVAGKVDTLLGMPFMYVLPNPTEVRLVAEVRRLRGLIEDWGTPRKAHFPDVPGERLKAEAEAIRAERGGRGSGFAGAGVCPHQGLPQAAHVIPAGETRCVLCFPPAQANERGGA